MADVHALTSQTKNELCHSIQAVKQDCLEHILRASEEHSHDIRKVVGALEDKVDKASLQTGLQARSLEQLNELNSAKMQILAKQ